MSLHKIWLILRSEFWRRVRSKAFLLATLLVPVGFIVLAAAPAVFGYLAEQTDERTVALVDETQQLADSLAAMSDGRVTFRPTAAPIDSVRAAVRGGQYDGYLLLPASLLVVAQGLQAVTAVLAGEDGREDKADDSGCEAADFLDGPGLDETERDRPPDSPGGENGDTDERGDWPLSNNRLDPIGSSRHFPSPPDGVHDECQFVRAVVRHDWSRERP